MCHQLRAAEERCRDVHVLEGAGACLEGGVIQLGWLQGVRPHVNGPVAWVHDVVVDDTQEAVERLRLIFVLNHSWL